jgi:hypothetical protein
MSNPSQKISPNTNDNDSFTELKHRQNYCRGRTDAFTYAMVHLISRTTKSSYFKVGQTYFEVKNNDDIKIPRILFGIDECEYILETTQQRRLQFPSII